ncbi:hypothetical protein HKD37_02G005901 [Glycine soja]
MTAKEGGGGGCFVAVRLVRRRSCDCCEEGEVMGEEVAMAGVVCTKRKVLGLEEDSLKEAVQFFGFGFGLRSHFGSELNRSPLRTTHHRHSNSIEATAAETTVQRRRYHLFLLYSSHSDLFSSAMGISKTEVNLRSMLREQLEQLAEERTLEGLPRISKAMLNDYSEKIEAIASKLVNHVVLTHEYLRRTTKGILLKKTILKLRKESRYLRRRPVLFYCCSSDSLDRPASSTEDKAHELAETDHTSPIKLDATAHAHVEKHRKLQEDLTDDMVVLAKQLKESSLTMSQSLQNTEKDSSRISYFHSILLVLLLNEKAIEHSLASTGLANVRATATTRIVLRLLV